PPGRAPHGHGHGLVRPRRRPRLRPQDLAGHGDGSGARSEGDRGLPRDGRVSEHKSPRATTGPVPHGSPPHGAPSPWVPSHAGHPWPPNPVLVVGKGTGLRPVLHS